jgi:hypothetical protein
VGGLPYATDNNGITIDMTFYSRYSSYNNVETSRDSINREMYPSRSTAGSTSSAARNEVDWVGAGLSLGGSVASLVSIATPQGRLIGMTITLVTMYRNIYKGYKGELEWEDVYNRNLEAGALAVGGEAIRKFAPIVSGGYDVFKHQWGLFKGGKKLLYDPNQ